MLALQSLSRFLCLPDIDGNPVYEAKHFGLKQSIKITKPGWILFADESGFSTSQKKDGHVGGQQFIVQKGTVPQTIASTTDHKFTLLPFTSASGEAVCCAVIFQGKLTEIPATWRTGVDVRVTPIMTENGEEIDVEMYLGKGKYYPGGPTCTYNGNTVDCLSPTASESQVTFWWTS